MKSQMRNRTGLLSRVSTLAIIAAAGGLGSVQQAQAACDSTLSISTPTVISSDVTCAEVTGYSTINGDVVNGANVGDPGNGFIPFFVGKNALINGQLINDDTISGGFFNDEYDQAGALTLDDGVDITGGIVNNIQIISDTGNGIQLGYSGQGPNLTGAITNNGIIGAGHDGVAALWGSASGGLVNNAGVATITGGNVAVYVADSFTNWSGGIRNFGRINGDAAGIQIGDIGGEGSVWFSGGIRNEVGGTITSYNGPTVAINGDTFSGGIVNDGLITQRNLAAAGGEGAYAGVGIAIFADTFNGGIVNSGQIDGLGGPAVWITSETIDFNGTITNSGNIDGADEGILFQGWNYAGNFNNSGSIHGDDAGVVFGSSNTDISNGGEGRAEFVNTGSIDGAEFGLRILGDNVDMNFTNTFADEPFPQTPVIAADSGAAVLLAATNWDGNITNNGNIVGGAVGMLVGGDFDDYLAVSSITQVTNYFSGTITNTGSIAGDTAGLYVTAGSFDGNITNDGTISGGETGAYIGTGSFDGQIVNNGVIVGTGFDTGLHIVTVGTHTGDIINNGTLSASSNALFADIGNLSGSIVNTGSIEVNPGATAVNLLIDNGATLVNTDGGIILGDVFFGGKASYNFVAEDGGIRGSLIGTPDGGEGGGDNDDVITVRNGTHYFVSDGSEGSGVAENFESFDVEDGGVAVMGALFVGAGSGTGYAFDNVDAVNVDNGGTLYIDKSTTLDVDDSYTQQAGGTLMFYLGAPGGEGFSSLTGTIVAGAGDYGQILVDGTADLDGTIAGFLDPAFADANSDLTQVDYNDVIVADGGITGDFTTVALISNSSLFELNEIIDGNTVDLRLTRTSLSDLGDIGGIIVNTNGPFDSMVSDRSNGIGSGSCGMAGPGWCFNRFAANEPGATSVMTDATPGDDPFDWLRTGVRRVGETAAWGRAVGVWGNTDGDLGVGGSDFNVAGAIVGVDHVFTPILMAGVAAQYTTSDIDFDGKPDNANVDSYEVGAYMSYGDTRLYLNANASVIWHNVEVNRFGPGGQAFGDYDGTTISGYAEAGKIFETYEGLRIQPLVALSYSHLETDAYSETGTANTLLNVFGSDFDSLKGMLGARFAYPIQMASGRKIVPEARIVWAHEFLDDQASFLATIQGPPNAPQLILGERFSRDTIMLGTGLTVPVSASSTFFIDYDAGLNSDITTHTVSAGFRFVW